MDKSRSEFTAPIIAAMLAAMFAAYVVAYFQLGTVSWTGPPRALVRTYHGQWQADLFTPGVIIEAWVRGHPVHAGHI